MSIEDDNGSSRERRERLFVRATQMLTQVGSELLLEEVINDMQVHSDPHSVHGFFSYIKKHPPVDVVGDKPIDSLVLHIQTFPDMSSQGGASIIARLMDREDMLKLRASGKPIGGEEDAVTNLLLEGEHLLVPDYSPVHLIDLVNDGILDLSPEG